jgi:predicted transcriptional regulator of viral defense system
MPREVIASRLYELAEGQDGYFSAAQAAEEAVSATTLGKAVKRGALTRVSRGVYRLARYPTVSENAHLWEAVLWPQARAKVFGTLTHYTALQLHHLSDANPPTTHITVPSALRINRELPQWLVLHRADLKPHEITFVDSLPVTTPQRTLLDIATLGDSVVLADALRDARERQIPLPYELMNA